MPVNNNGPHIQQEKKTLGLMITLYCQHHHHSPTLCDSCRNLQNYALQRLTFCRFGEQKKTCEKCPKHCYRSDYKAQIRDVMRYAGPRMLLHHPIVALRHLYRNLMK